MVENYLDQNESKVDGGDLIDAQTHRSSFQDDERRVDDHDLMANWKIVGRSREEQAIMEAYQRVREGGHQRDFVLVSGASGVGKTCLATVVRNQTEADYGHFVHGKFDHLQRPEPHAAFAEAFSGFVSCTVGRGEQEVKRVRRAISKVIGSEARILTNMVPQMESILPSQEETLETVNHKLEAANRFKFAIRSFLRAVSSPDHPFVILLDDLQWADDASLDLLVALLHDRKSSGCMFIGTYRSDDVKVSAKLMKVLSQLEENLVNLTVVELQNLKLSDVRSLVTDLLDCEDGEAEQLVNLLYEKTRGNPFLIRENLLHLRDRGCLTMNERSNTWTWDPIEVHFELQSTSNLIQSRLMSLSPTVTSMLKVASCLGTTLDEDILRHLLNEPVFHYFENAASLGLISMDHWHSGYEFSHDEIKMATYMLIPEDERESFHSNIGRSLWACLGNDEVDKYLFSVIGQFMLGDGQYGTLRERKEIALLYLRAGQRAVSMSSFQAAYTYLLQGIECLGENRWRDSYTLCLRLYNASAEVAYCVGHLSSVETLVAEVFKNARVPDDTFRSQATRIYALGGSGLTSEAISLGLNILKSLGVVFPSKPSMKDVAREMRLLRKTLKRKYTFESILRLPVMEDPRKLAAMEVLNLIFIYAFMTQVELAPLIGFNMVRLTLEHGLSAMSCLGFVMYAMCLCGFGDDIEEGYRYGQLSISILDKFKGRTWLVRLSAGYYGCVHAWKKPIQETLVPLKQAHRAGLESGDIEFAMLSSNLYTWSQFDICPLPKLDLEIQEFADLMDLHGQLTNRIVLKPVWQVIRNLMGLASGKPYVLTGDVMNESEIEQWKVASNNLFLWTQYYRMLLQFLFGNYDVAWDLASTCRPIVENPFGAVDISSVLLIETLTALVLCQQQSLKGGHLGLISKRLKMVRRWARHSPYNFLGTQFLLEAELAVVNDEVSEACSKYICAIALSKEGGSMMRTALANERFGKFYYQRGQKADAKRYIDESIKLYEAWGASAKAQHLKNEVRFVNFAN